MRGESARARPHKGGHAVMESAEVVAGGQGVVLRRPTEEDLLGVHAVHSDPRVYQLDPQETHTDIAYTRRWAQPIFEHWEQHGFGYWTVLVPGEWWPAGISLEGHPESVVAGMGGIQYFRWDRGDLAQVLNVYYRFGPQVQGRGLGGLVIEHAVAWATTNLPDLDLVVRTRPANGAAQHVARRAGFVDGGFDPDDPGMVVLRRRGPSSGV